jgi:hypothetical protein
MLFIYIAKEPEMSQPIGSNDVAVTRHTRQTAAAQYVEANERAALAKGGAPRENPLAYPKALRQPTLVVNWLYPYPERFVTHAGQFLSGND